MLIRIVKLPIQPLRLDEFMLQFNLSKEEIRSSEGCSYLELLCDAKKKNILYTYSFWNSEADLDKYLQSDLFKSTWAKVRPLFSEKPEAWSLSKVMTVESANKS